MKTFRFLSLLLLCAMSAHGQTPFVPNNDDNPPYHPPPETPKPHVAVVPQPDQPAPTGPDENVDAAKVAEYKKRFDEGYALEQQGKLADARKVYDGILAEEPHARRSLLEAGRISFKLGEMEKANDYLSKLRQLEPNFPEAIALLIQINQALKHDVKVELLVRDFTELRASGKVPELSNLLTFVRERFDADKDPIIISQFFDYTKDPNTVYMAEVFSPDGQLLRRILLNYDPDATKALREKSPEAKNTTVFTWFEHVITNGKVSEVKAYIQVLALPDYQKFRTGMLAILVSPPKPLYSQKVDDSSH